MHLKIIRAKTAARNLWRFEMIKFSRWRVASTEVEAAQMSNASEHLYFWFFSRQRRQLLTTKPTTLWKASHARKSNTHTNFVRTEKWWVCLPACTWHCSWCSQTVINRKKVAINKYSDGNVDVDVDDDDVSAWIVCCCFCYWQHAWQDCLFRLCEGLTTTKKQGSATKAGK